MKVSLRALTCRGVAISIFTSSTEIAEPVPKRKRRNLAPGNDKGVCHWYFEL
jgi:hypothetical protein